MEMVLLMLRKVELCGEERSIIRCFLAENFRVATPIRLMRETLNEEAENSPIMKLLSISFFN